jgi:hypothetical protein
MTSCAHQVEVIPPMPLDYDVLYEVLWELIFESVFAIAGIGKKHSWQAIQCLGHTSSGVRILVLRICSILLNIPHLKHSQ